MAITSRVSGGTRTHTSWFTARRAEPLHHGQAVNCSSLTSSPTRVRTWNTSLEAKDDRPFHHRAINLSANTAEGMGVERTRPLRVARFSKPARPTISGYLPFQWTGWESNPTHRLCKSQSPPWNMPARVEGSEVRSQRLKVTDRGVSPNAVHLTSDL